MLSSMMALRWLVMGCALLAAGCTIIIKKPVNDSPELRWWLFTNYGAREICPELRRQGLPLRLDPRSAAVGRFFPNRCHTALDEARRVVTVSLGGTGYGYAPVSGRVGFALDATIEYRMDFRIASRGIYVWGVPNRTPTPPQFRVLSVENRLAGMASASFGLGNTVGEQLLRGELHRGFTVLHTDRGNTFALGIVQPPHRPYTPFAVQGGAYAYANETVTVAMGQRDYLGPFAVMKPGQPLRLRFVASGAPAEVLVVNRFTGDSWRGAYEHGNVGPPPGPVLAGGPIGPAHPTVSTYPLPVGSYYVVIDNTAWAGRVAPRGAATVSYVAELLD